VSLGIKKVRAVCREATALKGILANEDSKGRKVIQAAKVLPELQGQAENSRHFSEIQSAVTGLNEERPVP
jgi:hypothetical protein